MSASFFARSAGLALGLAVLSPVAGVLVTTAHAATMSGGDMAGADMVMADGDVLGGTFTNVGRFVIPAGVTVTVTPGTPLEVDAQQVDVAGTLSADGAGYAGGPSNTDHSQPTMYWSGNGGADGINGSGPGGGTGGYFGACVHGNGGGGGGYGGAGGDSGYYDYAGNGPSVPSAGGAAYDPDPALVTMGSGGGSGSSECQGDGDGAAGGAGGGAISLTASSITVAGTISADGGPGAQGTAGGYGPASGGGGSGGGILLSGAGTVTGALHADGGAGADMPAGADAFGEGGGGGGGGRIKLTPQIAFAAPGVATVTGGTAGTSTTDATAQPQPGAAGTGAQVAPAAATTVTSAVFGSGAYAGTATLTATLTAAGTGLADKTVSFAVDGTPVGTAVTGADGVATLSGVDDSGHNAGTDANAVTAAFAGDATDLSSSGTGDLTITPADQTITFAPLAGKTFGDDPFPVSATASSGLPVAFTVGSTDSCTLSGTTVTITGTGSCTVTAAQAGDSNYNAAAPASQPVTIGKASQAITFTSPAPVNPVVSQAYDVTATGGGSANAVKFSIDPSTTNSACSLDANGHTVHFDHAGSCVIDADQVGNANYDAAPTQSQTIPVAPAAQAVTLTSAPQADPVVGDDYEMAGIGGRSGNTVTFSIDPATTNSACSLAADGRAVHFDHAGSCVLDGDQAASADYTTATRATQTVAIAQAPTATTITVTPNAVVATVTPQHADAAAPTGDVTFTVNGTPFGAATLVDGVATLDKSVPTAQSQMVAAAYGGNSDFTGSSASSARNNPTITATVTSATAATKLGWHRSPVTITFSCTTNGAALVGACPAPVTLAGNGAAQSVTRTVLATNGGAATTTVNGINIDRTRPQVGIAGVRNGVLYRTVPPAARCVARDVSSGIAACRVQLTQAGTVVTYRVSAMDYAGNIARTTGHYQLAPFVVANVPYTGGAYTVHFGHSYNVTAIAGHRVRYYDATPAAGRRSKPFKAGVLMRGTGHGRWTLPIHITKQMRHHTYWNAGAIIDGHLITIRLRILP